MEDGKSVEHSHSGVYRFQYPRQLVNVKEKLSQLAITADEVFAVSVEGKLYKWCLSDARSVEITPFQYFHKNNAPFLEELC